VRFQGGALSRKQSFLYVLPFWEEKRAKEAYSGKVRAVEAPVQLGDFKGKEGEILCLYPGKKERILLVGLGKKKGFCPEVLRRAYGEVGKFALRCKAKHLQLKLPQLSKWTLHRLQEVIAEGLLLVNYRFNAYVTEKKEGDHFLFEEICFQDSKPSLTLSQKVNMADGIYLARDLINGNADDITPQVFAKRALEVGRRYPGLKVEVFDRKRIEKEKMGLLLAVSKGSSKDPVFVVMQHKPAGKKGDHILLVGKGITHDCGGLNLKPTNYIETMKSDMSGAAVVLGTMAVISALQLPLHVSCVIPLCENSIGPKSYKPGDVYRAHSGKSVEIANTDAEGRLILADALSWACKKFHPTAVIDVATLTGAIVIALGEEIAGLFSNDDALARELGEAGNRTFERVWRLPLCKEYKEQLKSSIADLKSCGGREGGSITAALFLQEFVEKIPWAHLDIAGVAFYDKERRYHPKGGTGVGVRLLVDFLENRCKKC